jgi:hypothetical protein
VYYAPNTFQVLQQARRAKAAGREGGVSDELAPARSALAGGPRTGAGREGGVSDELAPARSALAGGPRTGAGREGGVSDELAPARSALAGGPRTGAGREGGVSDELAPARSALAGGPRTGAGTVAEEIDEIETRIFRSFDPRAAEGRAFYASIAPYALVRFGLAPLAFGVLGPSAALSVLVNTALAEAVSNVHTFCLIAPNHAGDDLHRFSERPVGRGELYARQVLGSADFTGGTDIADFLQGFLNYQIEHHLFPDLPPSKLREAQPAVQALCEKHGLPYVREPLHQRVRQLLGIMTGRRSMKRATTASDATDTRRRPPEP